MCCLCVCVCAHVCMCARVCMCVCVCVCVCMCVCLCVCKCKMILKGACVCPVDLLMYDRNQHVSWNFTQNFKFELKDNVCYSYILFLCFACVCLSFQIKMKQYSCIHGMCYIFLCNLNKGFFPRRHLVLLTDCFMSPYATTLLCLFLFSFVGWCEVRSLSSQLLSCARDDISAGVS